MSKNIRSFASIVAILLISILLINIFNKKLKSHKTEIIRTANFLNFNARDIENKQTVIGPLLGMPTLLIYFAPDCEHCHREAIEFNKYYHNLQNINIVWLSTYPTRELKYFAIQESLTNKPNVHVMQVTQSVANDTLHFFTTPSALIYKTNGTLLDRIQGEFSIEKLHLSAL